MEGRNDKLQHVQVSREYLAKAAETLPGSTPCGVNGIPVGKHVRCSSEPKWKKWFITFAHRRDDEQALLLLLQCGYSVEEALRRKRMNAGATELRKRHTKILFFHLTWVLTWILAVPQNCEKDHQKYCFLSNLGFDLDFGFLQCHKAAKKTPKILFFLSNLSFDMDSRSASGRHNVVVVWRGVQSLWDRAQVWKYIKKNWYKKTLDSGNSSSSLLPQVLLLWDLQGVREGLPQYSEPKSGHKVGTRISNSISPSHLYPIIWKNGIECVNWPQYH